MKLFKIKPNENLYAIFTYIQSNHEYFIPYNDLIQFCIDYEYYKELYEHFHIIRALLDEHNRIYTKTREEVLGVNPGSDPDDDDSLL